MQVSCCEPLLFDFLSTFSSLKSIDCVYPNKRRKGSNSAGPEIDGSNPKPHDMGRFTELVFTTNELPQVSPDDKLILGESAAPAPVVGSGFLNEPFGQSTFATTYNPAPQSLGVDSLGPGNAHTLQQSRFINDPITAQFNPEFVGESSTFEYSTFDEPLNWIPPSLIPSPFDAELEQDFSFILPPLPATPNLGQEYNLAIPLDSNGQIYQVPTTVSTETSEHLGFPVSLMGVDQSPASSASDGMNMAGFNEYRIDVRFKTQKTKIFLRPRFVQHS